MTKSPSPKADALRQMREHGPARIGAFKIDAAASKPKRKGKK